MNRKIINSLIIFIIAVAFKIFSALTIHPYSADGCLYLNIARSIAAGHGFYCSFNFYQYWGKDTIFYPALVFMHPIYPLFAGIVWYFFHSLAAVDAANVFVSAANCVILYLIVERMYNSTVGVFSALLLSVSDPMFTTSILPWSEQLHLFFLLSAVWWVADKSSLEKPANLLMAGFLLGLSYLVRVSGIYNLFIFSGLFIVFGGVSLKSFKTLFFFWLGFFIVLLPYELYCYFNYHIFYPEYPSHARVFNASREVGGAYFATKPVLRLPADFKFDFIKLFFSNVPNHLAAFAWAGYQSINFLLLVVFIKAISIFKNKRFDENLFFWIGMGHILFFSLSFYWLATWRLETHRYFLITSVFWIPLGVSALYELAQILLENYREVYLKVYFLILMILLVWLLGEREINNNQYSMVYFHELSQPTKDTAISRWINARSNPMDLIATTEYQVDFDLDRPVVSMPEGALINDTNMKDFLKIYQPKYILIGKPLIKHYKAFLDQHCIEQQIPATLQSDYTLYKL